jgi:predicted metal-dependent hydrolase
LCPLHHFGAFSISFSVNFMDARKEEQLFQNGIDAFNSMHFYEAHEHWEEVWLETPNPEKLFLQGLIQVAAAFHHYSRENRLGTRNLLHSGLSKLECFPDTHWGISVDPLRTALREWLRDLKAGKTPVRTKIPQIHVSRV